MDGKIVLEEHFALPATIDDSERYFSKDAWPRMRHTLVDIHEHRLALMDACGIERMLLSLNAPGIQAVWDTRRAIEVARQANDFVAEQVARNPTRFQALAALPMQDPDAAAAELTRTVRELGFRGALVNGFSQADVEDSALYYDLPQYAPFWATVAALGVPFYLHPRDPLPSRAHGYEGHPWLLGSTWAFTAETALHALRLMASGLFDRHPSLQIVLGHLGETLPANIWRSSRRLAKTPRGIPARRTLAEYLRANFHLTTSGNFRTPTLLGALAEVGADRILFSADYPFEDMREAAEWFDRAELSEADRLKIGRTNALRLFNLE
jgi:2,3-dihydroxybenzoate decarboxylase